MLKGCRAHVAIYMSVSFCPSTSDTLIGSSEAKCEIELLIAGIVVYERYIIQVQTVKYEGAALCL
jgi:hypothetical protein